VYCLNYGYFGITRLAYSIIYIAVTESPESLKDRSLLKCRGLRFLVRSFSTSAGHAVGNDGAGTNNWDRR